MWNYTVKNLCAFVRQGDYAHAGETEAIDMVMAPFAKKSDQLILDAGCGLGGTANYIQKNQWGKVYGCDIEPDAIKYAKTKYPNIDFYVADILNAHNIIKNIKFNIICLFNVFFTLPNQQLALLSLNKVAQNNASLVIFDYSNLCQDNEIHPMLNIDPKREIFKPIKPEQIENMLSASGWRLEKMIDISDNYKKWYHDLLEKIEKNEEKILKNYGKEYFDIAHSTYSQIYRTLLDKKSGGITVYARKI